MTSQQQAPQQAPPPYDERINTIRRVLAEATRAVTSVPDVNGAVSTYVAAVEGVVMRMQREIDMARLARDQYHQARDDLWRDNEMLRNEIIKSKQARNQVNSNSSSAAAVDLSRARSLPPERGLSDRDRATQRAREVSGGSGDFSGSRNGAAAQVGAMGAADDGRTQRNGAAGAAAPGAAVLPPPESPNNANSRANMMNSYNGTTPNDRNSTSAAAPQNGATASGTQSDQYQPIDNVLAVADIAARVPDFGGPASPAKLPMPPQARLPNNNNMNNNNNNNMNNNNNGESVAVFSPQMTDLLRDPNYAPLPVQSRNVPNAVGGGGGGMGQSGENYGEVPHESGYK